MLRINLCLLLIGSLLSLHAVAQSSLRIEGTVGAEWSNLKWDVAGNINGKSPNILSELQWKKLSGINYNILTSLQTGKLTYFLRSAISPDLKGVVDDTDYRGDNRTNVSYHEVFTSSDGRIFKTEAGIKLNTSKPSSLSIFSIKAGVRYRNQRLFLNQDINATKSYYNSRWSSVFLGMEQIIPLRENLNISIWADGELSDYEGYGNWKLRTDLAHPKSFIQNTTGYGLNAGLKANLHISSKTTLIALAESCYINSFKGIDNLYYLDNTSVSTRLNGVKSLSLAASLGLSLEL